MPTLEKKSKTKTELEIRRRGIPGSLFTLYCGYLSVSKKIPPPSTAFSLDSYNSTIEFLKEKKILTFDNQVSEKWLKFYNNHKNKRILEILEIYDLVNRIKPGTKVIQGNYEEEKDPLDVKRQI